MRPGLSFCNLFSVNKKRRNLFKKKAKLIWASDAGRHTGARDVHSQTCSEESLIDQSREDSRLAGQGREWATSTLSKGESVCVTYVCVSLCVCVCV